MDVTLRLRPPRRVQRLWYRRLGLTPPLAEGSSGPWHADWVRLLPYRWRCAHRAYAHALGFFWLACLLCDHPFGGHESGTAIPDPLRPQGGGVWIAVCSRCTRERGGFPHEA
jgi:hypothetical protein